MRVHRKPQSTDCRLELFGKNPARRAKIAAAQVHLKVNGTCPTDPGAVIEPFFKKVHWMAAVGIADIVFGKRVCFHARHSGG